jgi:CDGSH-type Zn-finger protein
LYIIDELVDEKSESLKRRREWFYVVSVGSASKPFCDGEYWNIGFKPDTE